jgi:RimJ/RimL family protein N-acetyltransferase
VHATVAVDNVASRQVLERAGFTQTGSERRSVIVRDGMHDGAAYELVRESPAPR